MSASHTEAPSDRKAAYTGLIVGAVAVFVILFGSRQATNAQFAGEAAKRTATEAPK